jgi:hypothetical protein
MLATASSSRGAAARQPSCRWAIDALNPLGG